MRVSSSRVLNLLLCASLFLGLSLARAPVPSRGEQPAADPQPEIAPGQVIVVWEPSAHSAPELAAARIPTARVLATIQSLRMSVMQVSVGSERQLAERWRSLPGVRHAEPNYRVRALDIPNDPYWPDQWALTRIGVSLAWDVTHTEGVVVALLDSGAKIDHPDLQDSLWANPGEIPDNGLDDDGNSRVDDIHGWHFFQQWNGSTYQPYENCLIDDQNGHGTHVTGIVAATTNNGIGIAGVSRGARAMVVKVLDERGEGWYSDVAAGMVYAVNNGARIINLSLGGSEPSQILQDAIDYAHQSGALIIASTGNDGGAVLYPAAGNHVMAVASTNLVDSRSSFSNFGPAVDIAAPGESIVSTWPWLDGYYRKQGTSMASPHVAGAAALLWTWRPDYSSGQIEQRLKETADDVNAASHPGPDPYLGWGRLNIQRALADLPPGPTATPSPTPSPTPIPWEYRIYLPLVPWAPQH